tara:strand:+ start:183 stop:374 length:192 start_codon:yes stop_codon:yes gene_type:complete
VKNKLSFLTLIQIKPLKTQKRSINMPGHYGKKKPMKKKKKGMTKTPKKMSMKRKRRGGSGYGY